ncbi:MAG TPA: UDP-glucose/GDP-mannose dehydrogenase family protein [Thermomicrobiales bacterium]|jgi:UDPglucose 6-dehydrogenase|nr:UDP-glucose 6-dehydrogenase [Chloroflexota bacterium]HQX62883.1 UDP-glucose/GDP-mannose dehydrogenase family protein [Thermomicrobiales bacterium]HBY44709.1 UDP-glucose 6-dehydrogenase [Chloroflexota bacterium]HCG31067.1 UDP-glucose 6-dehydrogenase [Chloroflexota bacterium]HQZ88848.1 UDP-glucose/GDP-mannose dehydrogenase family protein [Thermomicrobiales bacterium]
MARISIIGSGYVGLVSAAAFADLGNDVTGIDIDENKVASLRRGECPIYEPGLPELLTRNLKAGRLRFTTSYADAVPDSEFVFICVDTPQSFNGEADMRAVRRAATTIAQHLRGATILVNKSTMPIGSGDLVAKIVKEHTCDEVNFSVVSNPEFLREGSAVHDVMHPERIVLGSDDRQAAEKVADLYRVLQTPIVITDLRSAEMIKYASNAFLATKISFINEIARICERVGADVTVVAKGMGHDARIGPLFLEAGIGYGGSCFPKDVSALAYMAEEANTHPQLLRAVIEINNDQRRRFVQKLQEQLGDLTDRQIGVWGLAFKQNTDDMRESPAIDIIRMIEQRGGTVRAYDPAAAENARPLLPNTTICSSPYDAIDGADALCVITPWNEFKQANLGRVAELMRTPLLLDGRNLYDPSDVQAHGLTYVGIGR